MCSSWIEERKTVIIGEGLNLPCSETIKSLDVGSGYKYLGVFQVSDILHSNMKDKNNFKVEINLVLWMCVLSADVGISAALPTFLNSSKEITQNPPLR